MKTNAIKATVTAVILVCIAIILFYLSMNQDQAEPVMEKYSTVNTEKTISENKDEVHTLLAVVDENGKYGMINMEGELMCEYKYDVVTPTNYGLYYVKSGKLSGFINSQFEEIMLTEEIISANVSEGFTIYTQNDKKGFINVNTGEKIEAVYEAVYDFSQGLAAVQLDGKVGFINTSGEMVIPNIYYPNALYTFTSDLCNVIVSDDETGERKSYYIDKEGNIAVSGNFQYGMPFYEEMAFVKENEMWHVIDKTGNKRGDMQFGPYEKTVPTRFRNGCAVVMENGKYGVINTNMKYVLEPKYENLSAVSDDLFAYCENGKYGLMNIYQTRITYPVYDSISAFEGDYAVITKEGKYGVISKWGVVVIQPEYTKAEILKNGTVKVYKEENRFSYMNLKGKIIWEPEKV